MINISHASDNLRVACNIGLKIPKIVNLKTDEDAKRFALSDNGIWRNLGNGILLEKPKGLPVSILGYFDGVKFSNYWVVISEDRFFNNNQGYYFPHIITTTYSINSKNIAVEWFDKIKTIMQPDTYALLRMTKFNDEYYYYYIEIPKGNEPYMQSFLSIEGRDIIRNERFPKGFYTSICVFSDDKPIKTNSAIVYAKGPTIKRSFKLLYDKVRFIDNSHMIYRTDASEYAMWWYHKMISEKSLTYEIARSNKFEKRGKNGN